MGLWLKSLKWLLLCISQSASSCGNTIKHHIDQDTLMENTYCRKANAVEHMIVDAFVEADPFFKLADATEDAQAFALLDDSILKVRRAYAACWHLMLQSCLQKQLHIGGNAESLSARR